MKNSILFNSEMVRAILELSKSQTRRPMKHQPRSDNLKLARIEKPPRLAGKYCWTDDQPWQCPPYFKPEYEVGQTIYVRENFADVNIEGGPGLIYQADLDTIDLMDDDSFLLDDRLFNYKDKRVKKMNFCTWSADIDEIRWTPSIHMPEWAARIFLGVVEVWPERLHDITEENALAEGIKWTAEGPLHAHYNSMVNGVSFSHNFATAKEAYFHLWDSCYGKTKYKSDSNPWVWAYDFKLKEVKK